MFSAAVIYLLDKVTAQGRCVACSQGGCIVFIGVYHTRTHSTSVGREVHSIVIMKYGKYDIRKSSANISVGTSYSWYYKKNDNSTTKKKKSKLVRTASDSTLFSDYANQIMIFDREKRNKRCKKSISGASKNQRVKRNVSAIKSVQMEPFTGNFYYGDPLPGYKFGGKSEEKITYLPDSDDISPSDETITTLESITPAPTVVDVPELVKNPLYGCHEADMQLITAEYFTDGTSKDSQLNTSTCTEIKETMCSNKDSESVYNSILRDFKRNMKEWNNTIMEHYSSQTHTNREFSMRKSNASSYVQSLHSTLSCRKVTKKCANRSYDYAYVNKAYDDNICESRKNPNVGCKGKSKTLDRNQTFNTNATGITATLKKLKAKAKFWKDNMEKLSSSECECLEAIYEDYDRRLQEWCDSLSSYSTLIDSSVRLFS